MSEAELRMDAYYYGFTFTGVREIDMILSAVACAGKAYHHTNNWSEETPAYEYHEGATPVDWIQNAADKAAAAWNRRARAEQAERERDEAREALHYANGTAELAMKHRDTAEARVKELEDRLRCGEGSDRERQLLRKLEKLVTRVRALEAALLKVTCDQAATPADWHEARAALKGE